MKSRLAVIVAAVVVPLAVLGFVVTRNGGSAHRPASLPIAAGGGAGTEQAARADMALYPYGGIVYKAGADLPALDGSARAYKVTLDADAMTRLGSGNDSGVSSSGVVVACPPDALDCAIPATTIPQRPANLPSHDEAKAIALDFAQRAGVDTTNVAVTVDDFTTQWSVRIDPIVDGITTEGFGTNVTIGDEGVIEYASGVVGTVEVADEYPLIGTTKAIALLNEGRGSIGPVPLEAVDTPGFATADSGATGSGAAGSTSAGSASPGSAPPAPPDSVPPDTAPPDTPTTGTIPPPSPQEITLTGVERVLMFAPSYDGTNGYLVPGYRFQTADGDGPVVLAIDESFIAPPPGTFDSGSGSKGGAEPGVIEPQPAPAPDQGPPDTVEPPRDQ